MDDTQHEIAREEPNVDPTRKAFIDEWTKRIVAAKEFHKGAFEQMRKNMQLARLGADGDWIADGNYTANLIQRHINQSVAALYARNPRASAKRRPTLDYNLWDGDPQTLAMSAQAAQMGDPMAQAVIQEVQQVQQRNRMLARMGKTLECLFHYFINEQEPRFKRLMKQVVRRSKVCGVGYIKLNFQRVMETRPDISAQINDMSERIAHFERILADVADNEVDPDSAELEDMRTTLEALQAHETVLLREGPVFTAPRATRLIIDPKMSCLDGFIGAGWIAEEYMMSKEDIQATYKVDIGSGSTPYRSENLSRYEQFLESDDNGLDKKDSKSGLCAVWEVWNKQSGTVFTITDGYCDYLREPQAPKAPLERFWPYFPLSFNYSEHEDEQIPVSDVQMLTPMQEEYNRSRQGLREQRRANRPKYFTAKGRLEESDKDVLMSHPANAVIELKSVEVGQRIEELIQPWRPVPIDPAMYDTGPVFDDVLRTVGTQEAQLGGLAGATATESSIAEGARISTESSNVDELDEMLTDIARATGQLMLHELSADTVFEIAGRGAVWPELTLEQIAKEVSLEVQAGSSGRPNRAAELANLERAATIILQIPGISPTWFGRQVLERLDDGIDVDEAIVEGMPSIVAMNAMVKGGQPSTGDPATDPGQQGDRGGERDPAGQNRNEPGPQPAFPASVGGVQDGY